MKNTVRALLLTVSVCGLLAGTPAKADFSQASTVTTSMTTMRTALTTDDITAVQTALVNQGDATGGVDGKWGPRTADALRSFQGANGLEINGLPTPATLAALGVAPTNPPVAVNTEPGIMAAPEQIEPAAGGGAVYEETIQHTQTTSEHTTGFATVDTSSENGSTCLTCTNGPIGNGSTPSMRSNEY